MWRRGGKEEWEQYSTYHRRKLGPECFCVKNQKERKKNKNTHRKGKKGEIRISHMLLWETVYYLLLAKLQRALISKELDMGSHVFPLYLFKCLFEERVLKSFLCCTIFSTPGGHPAPLLNICKLQTMFPMLPFLTFPIWSIAPSFDMTSILSLCFTPLSRTCPPSLFAVDFFPPQLLRFPDALFHPVGER